MCRNIRTLHHFEPPASEEEISAAALQYVRKISGSTKPSKANTVIFHQAVSDVAVITRELLNVLVATGEPKNREQEIQKARARWQKRSARLQNS